MRCSRDGPGALILGGGVGALAATRNLAHHGVKVCVYGSRTSVARFSGSVDRFVRWPRDLDDDRLPGYLAETAERHGVEGWVLFPSSDEQLRVLAQRRSFLAGHYVPTTPPWEIVRFLYDKRMTYTLAREVGVAFPRIYRLRAGEGRDHPAMDFPVVVKPAITSRFLEVTNRKAYRADGPRELRRLCGAMARVVGPSQVIVQDCLPDPGKNLFSFAGYFRKGIPVAGLSARRTRQLPWDFGRSSTFVETVDAPELERLATHFLSAIDYTGLAEVEFMWNARRARYELLEVNARLWAWHGLAPAAGIDLPYLAYAEALGRHLPRRAPRPGVKWARLLTDVRAVARDIGTRAISLRQYVRVLRSSTTFAVLSSSDPVPFLVEPLLLLIARLHRLYARVGAMLFRRPGPSGRRNTDPARMDGDLAAEPGAWDAVAEKPPGKHAVGDGP